MDERTTNGTHTISPRRVGVKTTAPSTKLATHTKPETNRRIAQHPNSKPTAPPLPSLPLERRVTAQTRVGRGVRDGGVL